jgi:8-oxo-dGTP pyrophosphatase MutT (NUDIX family)
MTQIIDESWYVRSPDCPAHDSAGGIVVRREGDRILVALGNHDGYQSYVLPKGKVDAGEDLLQAAIREIEEEAGFTDLRLLAELGCCERFDYHKTSWKRTHYFLFLTEQVDVEPTDAAHHQAPAWFPLEEHPDLFWPEQQELLEHNRHLIQSRVVAATLV